MSLWLRDGSTQNSNTISNKLLFAARDLVLQYIYIVFHINIIAKGYAYSADLRARDSRLLFAHAIMFRARLLGQSKLPDYPNFAPLYPPRQSPRLIPQTQSEARRLSRLDIGKRTPTRSHLTASKTPNMPTKRSSALLWRANLDLSNC